MIDISQTMMWLYRVHAHNNSIFVAGADILSGDYALTMICRLLVWFKGSGLVFVLLGSEQQEKHLA